MKADDLILDDTIARYFHTLNAGAFEETAALFAEDGALHPPFEEPVVGPEAIAQYLQAEAVGIQLHPHQSLQEPLEDGDSQFKVTGKVQTSLLGVNVSWLFVLDPQSKIKMVRIDLLATLEELLPFRK